MLPRLFVIIENAWIAAIAAAVTRIGLNRWRWRRIVAQFVIGSGSVVVHGQARSDIIDMVARVLTSSPHPTPYHLEHV
jgi:hypothetical protein